MKQTLSTSHAVSELVADEYAGWSYAGAYALVEYLEQYEEECDTEIEFDPVAFRCDFSEYESAVEAAGENGWEPDEESDEEEREEEALEWLRNQTTVIEFDGGFIIQQF